jgi:hypothetical protein
MMLYDRLADAQPQTGSALLAGCSVGLTGCFDSPHDHIVLRVDLDAAPTRLDLVHVAGGTETVLATQNTGAASGQGPIVEPPPSSSRASGLIRLELSIRRHGHGVYLIGRAGEVMVEGFALAAQTATGRFGYYARSADAWFTDLTVSRPETELTPETRYRLQLLGGAGGRTLLRDTFRDAIAEEWTAAPGDWNVSQGLWAAGPGSALGYSRSLADCELITEATLAIGDALTVALRTQVGDRPHKTRYAVTLTREPGRVDVTVSAGLAGRSISASLAQGSIDVGPVTEFPIRIRLVGDRLAVWCFDFAVVDIVLETETVQLPALTALPAPLAGIRSASGPSLTFGSRLRPRSTTIPLVWEGGLEWRATAGAPGLRSIEIRDPVLFSAGFTTSRYSGFAGHLKSLAIEAAFTDEAGTFAERSVEVNALVTAQRSLANARIDLRHTEEQHRSRRADRAELEANKQAATVAAADHDDGFQKMLGHFGAAHLPAPARTTAHRLQLSDGTVLGYLLRSDETLWPELIPFGATSPFDSIGRTSFQLAGADGQSALPTGWIASSDGTQVLIYRRVASTPAGKTTPDNALAITALDNAPKHLSATFVRHHGDDIAPIDHRLDRPYLLRRSSRADETVTLLPLQ